MGMGGNACEKSEEEIAYGASSKIATPEAVRDLRDHDGPETDRCEAGRCLGLPEEAALFPNMRKLSDGCEEGNLQSTRSQIKADGLRGMWSNEAPSCSPPRRGLHEQRSVEPADVVRFLSSTLALGAWQETVEAAIGLQNMRIACAEVGYVSEALSTLPQIWRSMPDEARERIGRLLCAGGCLIWESFPLLTIGQPNRVGAIRGFGNAIVPQVAAEFIRAAIEGVAR
jgi:hypothetical protein